MRSTVTTSRNRGFSLIEVLIAVVVLSFGLLALSALQGSLFKASAEAKAQSVGLALASEKLEFFRGYKDSSTYLALTTGADGSAATPLTVGGVDYTRSWTVTRYAHPDAGGSFVSLADITAPLSDAYSDNNEFKRVEVTVGWVDAQGQAQSLTLEDAIAAIDPGDSRKLAKNSTAGRPRGPEVKIYTPTSLQEGVIPIAVGTGDDDTATAATNPKPLINAGNVIETRFDVLTYYGQSGNTAISQSRIQTSVAACECDTATKPVSSTARGKRPTYWDGTQYVIPEDTTYVPLAGESASAPAQSDLCVLCCRDHHDPAGLTAGQAKFDPRNASHVTSHTWLNGELSADGRYTEACRVIRVGGFFRVAADTYNDYMNMLDTVSLLAPEQYDEDDVGKSPYVPHAVATENYQAFVKGYLDERIVSQASEAELNTVLATKIPETSLLESTHGINDVTDSIAVQAPLTFRPGDAPKWLHLRGLYVDYLEPSAIQAVKDARDNCPGTESAAPTPLQLESCVLRVLPFTSINLTELGVWTPEKTAPIVVGNNNFGGTLSSVEPVRGKVSLGVSRLNNATTNALVALRRSSSGLTTLSSGINAEDDDDTPPWTWTATQPIMTQGSSAGGGAAFTVALSGYPNDTDEVSIEGEPAASCSDGDGDKTFDCTTTATLPSAYALTLRGYNYFTPTDQLGSVPLTCASSTSVGVSTTRTFSPNSKKRKINVCKNFRVSSSNLGGTVVDPSTTEDGRQAEATLISYPSIGDSNAVQLGVEMQADTYAYTCTFEGDAPPSNDNSYDVTPAPCPK